MLTCFISFISRSFVFCFMFSVFTFYIFYIFTLNLTLFELWLFSLCSSGLLLSVWHVGAPLPVTRGQHLQTSCARTAGPRSGSLWLHESRDLQVLQTAPLRPERQTWGPTRRSAVSVFICLFCSQEVNSDLSFINDWTLSTNDCIV